MNITIVRHGETDDNVDGIIQGRLNTPLNDKGRIECKFSRKKIRTIDYDICFSSPLFRSMETAMILVGEDTLIEKDERLIDRDMGEYTGELKETFDIKKYWDYDLNCTENGVEGIKEFYSRTESFLNYLKENYSNKNILIVTHEMNVVALTTLIQKKDLTTKDLYFNVKNCDNKTFKMD